MSTTQDLMLEIIDHIDIITITVNRPSAHETNWVVEVDEYTAEEASLDDALRDVLVQIRDDL